MYRTVLYKYRMITHLGDGGCVCGSAGVCAVGLWCVCRGVWGANACILLQLTTHAQPFLDACLKGQCHEIEAT